MNQPRGDERLEPLRADDEGNLAENRQRDKRDDPMQDLENQIEADIECLKHSTLLCRLKAARSHAERDGDEDHADDIASTSGRRRLEGTLSSS
jgi:hypothetical protein